MDIHTLESIKSLDFLELESKYVGKTYSSISEQFDITRYNIWSCTADAIKSILEDTNDEVIILEVGAGNGRNLIAIYELYKNIKLIAVEPCLEFCKILETKTQISKVIHGGHFSLPQIEPVDIVLSIAVIHHLATHQRRIDAIKELLSLAKVGGYVVIQVMAKHRRNCKKWKQIKDNDYLIPWVRTSDWRFYHLFEKNELEGMIKPIINVELINSFEDKENYGVILKKYSLRE